MARLVLRPMTDSTTSSSEERTRYRLKRKVMSRRLTDTAHSVVLNAESLTVKVHNTDTTRGKTRRMWGWDGWGCPWQPSQPKLQQTPRAYLLCRVSQGDVGLRCTCEEPLKRLGLPGSIPLSRGRVRVRLHQTVHPRFKTRDINTPAVEMTSLGRGLST